MSAQAAITEPADFVYLAPDLEQGLGYCALDDVRGSGHDGPCAHICKHCNGSGECPACDGTGDDKVRPGLPRCDEGMVTDA